MKQNEILSLPKNGKMLTDKELKSLNNHIWSQAVQLSLVKLIKNDVYLDQANKLIFCSAPRNIENLTPAFLKEILFYMWYQLYISHQTDHMPNQLSIFLPLCLGARELDNIEKTQGSHWVCVVFELNSLNWKVLNDLNDKALILSEENKALHPDSFTLKGLYDSLKIISIDSLSWISLHKENLREMGKEIVDVKEQKEILNTGQSYNGCAYSTVGNGFSYLVFGHPIPNDLQPTLRELFLKGKFLNTLMTIDFEAQNLNSNQISKTNEPFYEWDLIYDTAAVPFAKLTNNPYAKPFFNKILLTFSSTLTFIPTLRGKDDTEKSKQLLTFLQNEYVFYSKEKTDLSIEIKEAIKQSITAIFGKKAVPMEKTVLIFFKEWIYPKGEINEEFIKYNLESSYGLNY